MISIAENRDCMIAMKEFPDKFFDLAVVDPEFGINISKSPRLHDGKKYNKKDWDNKTPDECYFKELFRVSKNQIIWGGNYYSLPPSKHCIVWDKKQPEDLSFGMFDYAWTSFDGSNKIFRQSAQLEKERIHPTQKPIALYSWIFHNYAKAGDKILDTHLGSGSSRIAAHKSGLDFWGYELDSDYFAAQEKRFNNYKSQLTIDFQSKVA